MTTYFPPNYTIPASAFGLRFDDREKLGLEAQLEREIPKFHARFNLPPTHVAVGCDIGLDEIAGLDVVFDKAVQPGSYELRTRYNHGDCVCMVCGAVYNHKLDMVSVSHGYCPPCGKVALEAIKAE